MAKFVNITGPIVADTVYVDKSLVARDVAFTLPEVTPMTTDLQVMGTMTYPIWQLLDNMETTITKIGVDSGLRRSIKPGMHQYEFRWVQVVTDATGNTKNVGCKAFIKGVPNKIPGIGMTIGESSENEITIMTTYFALYVNGKEFIKINRLAGICKIDGKDYANISSML